MPDIESIRYGSVCSGVEAATLAWEKLGWKPVFFSEVEPFPCAVLQQRLGATRPLRPLEPAEATDEKERKVRENWKRQLSKLPDVGTIPNLGDFTKIKETDYEGDIDLLVGGTPCQDVSFAGKREGFDGKRSCLAVDFVRLAYELKTKWFVWENVPGVFSSNGRRDFSRFLSLFTGCEIKPPGRRFGNAGFVCNARRDRFGVAWRVLDARFVRTTGFPHGIPQRRRRVFVVGYFGDWKRAVSVLFDPESMSGDSFKVSKKTEKTTEGTRRSNQEIFVETGKGFYTRKTSFGTLEQHEEQHRRNIVVIHGSQDPILNTNHANAVNRNKGLENCIFDGITIRRIMPIECERLMGFPDNYTRIAWKGNPEEKCPDSPRYKACGNSMCVNCMEWIGRRIEQVEKCGVVF